MGQYDALITAAKKALNSADNLLKKQDVSFGAIYKQYKILQSFWFRIIDEATDSNSRQLENLCVELEIAVAKYEKWIHQNSKNDTLNHTPAINVVILESST